MRKIQLFVIAALASVFLASCMRDPIVYPVSNYYLSVENDIPLDQRNEILAVNLYDPNTGTKVFYNYIHPYNHPKDRPVGGYLDGVMPGTYDLLVYGYDSRVTRVNNNENISKIFADTESIGYNNGVPIIKMPDHMVRYFARIEVPYVTENDKVHIIPTRPETVVETVHFILRGIRNYELAESFDFYVSGMAPGRWLKDDAERLEGNSIIYLNGTPQRTKAEGEVGTYEMDVLTFGRNVEGNRVLLTVVLTADGGITSYTQVDVTEKFEAVLDGEASAVDIYLDLEATERLQGGFNPTTELWEGQYEYYDL